MFEPGSHHTPADTGALHIARLQLTAGLAAACADLEEQAPTRTLARLQAPVRRFSRQARLDGIPVERMLAVLKECVGESTLRQLEHHTYDAAREQVVAWAIDEFYLGSDGTRT